MSRGRPLKRLLVLPVVVLGLLVLGLHMVQSASPRPVQSAAGVPTPTPPQELHDRVCQRGHDPLTIAELRTALQPGTIVRSADVVACPSAYEGRRVHYRGEVVGDLLHREGGAWAQVNDDDYALELGPLPAHREYRGTNSGLAVWLPDPLLTELGAPGRPGRRGEVVEVVGRIRRTDPTDGGGLTLRADQLRVLVAAAEVSEPLDRPQLALALGAFGLAAALAVARRRSR